MSKPRQTGFVMPERLYEGYTVAATIGSLLMNYENHKEGERIYHEAERYCMGYPLPPWQRELKWTVEQQKRFVESIWLRFHLGIYVINKPNWENGGKSVDFGGILIDGQQRLYALEQYIEDAFPVFGGYWSEVDIVSKRKFQNIPFAYQEVAIYEEDALRELYDRLNYGGTPHEEHERAVKA